MRRFALVTVACWLILAGCAASSYEPPSPAVSAAEVDAVQVRADDYRQMFYDAWPEIGPATEMWAVDITSNDPLNSEWVFEGRDTLVPLWTDTMAPHFSDLEWVVEDTYLGTDSFVYQISSEIWPPWVPEPEQPETLELDWWRFDGDEIAGMSFWFADETATAIGAGCFEDASCDPDVEAIVATYVSAWTSGDSDQIASLYAANATFTDGMYGIEATGASDISRLAETRFGVGSHTIVPTATYVQTDGFYGHAIFGVGIMYTVQNGDGDDILHSVTLMDLGELHPGGETGSASLDPDGLIVRETVFHLGADLEAATR